MTRAQFRRIVLKLSGEALSGKQGYGIEPEIIQSIANQVKEVSELGVEIAVEVGGGDIWRGKIGSKMGMDGVIDDYVGMMTTVINNIALYDNIDMQVITKRVHTSN